MGSSDDFKDEDLRRLVVNATFYLAGVAVPAKADVAYVDPFKPSFYTFNRTPGYYQNLKLKVEQYAYGSNRVTGPTQEEAISALKNRKKKPAKKQGALITPKKGQSIAFIGNALAERLTYYGRFETLFHSTFPT